MSITATDLVPGMLEAQRIGRVRVGHLGFADTLTLPYDDASFDVVVCQFGAMFFAAKSTRSPKRHACSDRADGSR